MKQKKRNWISVSNWWPNITFDSMLLLLSFLLLSLLFLVRNSLWKTRWFDVYTISNVFRIAHLDSVCSILLSTNDGRFHQRASVAFQFCEN